MREEIREQQRPAPCIHEDVVEALHQLEVARTEPHQAQAHQRRASEVEALGQFLLQHLVQLLLGSLLIHTAPVEELHRRRHLAVDHLQLGVVAVPGKAGAQCLVTLHDAIPGPRERIDVDLRLEAVAVLHQVHAGTSIEQRV
ncbi:hypothetical protein D3C71_955780 [compost metagenome]